MLVDNDYRGLLQDYQALLTNWPFHSCVSIFCENSFPPIRLLSSNPRTMNPHLQGFNDHQIPSRGLLIVGQLVHNLDMVAAISNLGPAAESL